MFSSTMILMESSNILITGVGSLGCSWAKGAWSRSDGGSDILLIDEVFSVGDLAFSKKSEKDCRYYK